MTGSGSAQRADEVREVTRRRIEIFRDAGDDWPFAASLKSITEDTAQEYEGRAVLPNPDLREYLSQACDEAGSSLETEQIVPVAGTDGWSSLRDAYTLPPRLGSLSVVTAPALAAVSVPILDPQVGRDRQDGMIKLHSAVLGQKWNPAPRRWLAGSNHWPNRCRHRAAPGWTVRRAGTRRGGAIRHLPAGIQS